MHEDVIIFKEREGKAGGGKGILYDIDRTFALQTLGEQICVYDARGNGDGETVNNLTGDHENRITDYTAVVAEREAVMYAWDGSDISPTLTKKNADGSERMPDKGNFNYVVGIGRDAFNMGKNAQYGMSISEDLQPPMTAKGPGAVASHYIIRRLTPTERQRLQGFPDGWDIPEAADTKKYKMWGNGMAKPCVKYILSNIDEEENPHG